MTETTDQRREADQRRDDCALDGAYALAILYTLGYLGMVFMLMFFPIPTPNRDPLLTLFGLMSAAQMAIVKYFYDSTRAAERAQAANISRATRTDAVVQDIAKAAPVAAAVAAAASNGAASSASSTPPPINADTVEVAANTATITPAAAPTDERKDP